VRIAQIAPLYESVPPRAYGGTERVVAGLCDELSLAGHEVTLFASGDSSTRAHLSPMAPAALREHMTKTELVETAPHLHLQMLSEVFRRGDEFDVIHAHTDLLTLPFVRFTATPTVITMHGRLDLDSVCRILPLYPEVPLVSVSDHQRRALDGFPLRWMGTVYNGLNVAHYHQVAQPKGDYLAFVGRITTEKRPDWAVEVARRAGRRLRVAAKVDPADVEYWRSSIEPLFQANDVENFGEITEAEKPAFFGGAAATLLPIDWPEPFGLVIIESLAAGTPVIALDRGSVSELVVDGVTGFVCRDLDEMTAAVGRLDEIDPQQCRMQAARFTAGVMARRYLDVFRRVCGEQDQPHSAPDSHARTTSMPTPMRS
jgi:glycosyltransferase involved in cell wall biosynthesis